MSLRGDLYTLRMLRRISYRSIAITSRRTPLCVFAILVYASAPISPCSVERILKTNTPKSSFVQAQVALSVAVYGPDVTYRLLAPVGVASIFLTTNIPSTTLPNTQCFPSRNSAGAHVTKNWGVSGKCTRWLERMDGKVQDTGYRNEVRGEGGEESPAWIAVWFQECELRNVPGNRWCLDRSSPRGVSLGCKLWISIPIAPLGAF
jgi:hypothetical protein